MMKKNMETKPLVSILLPAYNAGKFLRAAVESILSQTYSRLEIIVIDDGSTDGSIESLDEITSGQLRILSQQNSGKSVALNYALEQISGEFYAIQDADDISYPDRIRQQVECMQKNPELAAVFTGHDIIFKGNRLAPRFAPKSREDCHTDIEQLRIPAHDATPMYRVSMVKEIRYEPMLKIGQGIDYILRVGELYPMQVLGACLYSYRVHFNSSITRDIPLRKQMIAKVFSRACERRGVCSPKCVSDNSRRILKFKHQAKEAHIVPHFMESVLDLRNSGQTLRALKTALACLSLHPYDPYYYKPLAYFLAPLSSIRYYRSRKARIRP
jgi:glycosyltransferase involved in cell wall biosynthesis